jgi:hypothetical protein
LRYTTYLVVSFITLILVTACDDTIKVTDLDNIKIPSSNVSYAKYIQPVFTAKCANAGCHDDQNRADGLSLTSWSNATSNFQIVAPAFPQNSRLVWRINGTAGILMPPIGYWALNKNQIDGITTWIKEGAQNN